MVRGRHSGRCAGSPELSSHYPRPVITAAAICPHPPLLVRELGGSQDPLAELRGAAVTAVREVTSGAERVVVVGPDDRAGSWDASLPEDVRRFGTTGERTTSGLPLPLAIGRRLLRDADWSGPVELRAVARHTDDDAVEAMAAELAARPDGTVVVLLGEGSARRGDSAPGYLDERAFSFDDCLATALADGDARALCDIDTDLAEDLMVFGATSFRILGALALHQMARGGAEPSGELTYRADPFGVSYLVGTWRLCR